MPTERTYHRGVRARVVLLLSLGACTRDPLPAVCPDVAEGGLAISEIRKAGSSDTLVSWVELYNASGGALDLYGLVLRFRNPTGASETDVTVRRSLVANAGQYVVLGLVADDASTRPSYVDYGFLDDFGATFPSSAVLDVDACGATIDRAQWSSLPSTGSYAVSGAMAPDAGRNDFAQNWCTDATPAGTPQQPNLVCP